MADLKEILLSYAERKTLRKKLKLEGVADVSKRTQKQQKELDKNIKELDKLNLQLKKITHDLLVGRDKYFKYGLDGNIEKAKKQMTVQKELTRKKKEIIDQIEALEEKIYALGMASEVPEREYDAVDEVSKEIEQEVNQNVQEVKKSYHLFPLSKMIRK